MQRFQAFKCVGNLLEIFALMAEGGNLFPGKRVARELRNKIVLPIEKVGGTVFFAVFPSAVFCIYSQADHFLFVQGR